MSAEEVDDYVTSLDEPKRGLLEALRGTIQTGPREGQRLRFGLAALASCLPVEGAALQTQPSRPCFLIRSVLDAR
jgi:hypothetical protein